MPCQRARGRRVGRAAVRAGRPFSAVMSSSILRWTFMWPSRSSSSSASCLSTRSKRLSTASNLRSTLASSRSTFASTLSTRSVSFEIACSTSFRVGSVIRRRVYRAPGHGVQHGAGHGVEANAKQTRSKYSSKGFGEAFGEGLFVEHAANEQRTAREPSTTSTSAPRSELVPRRRPQAPSPRPRPRATEGSGLLPWAFALYAASRSSPTRRSRRHFPAERPVSGSLRILTLVNKHPVGPLLRQTSEPRACCYLAPMSDTKVAVQRFLRGHRAAERRQHALRREQGPQPDQAVAEALAAVSALAAMGLWPGPRDPVNESAVTEVRRRWAKIERRAMRGRAR